MDKKVFLTFSIYEKEYAVIVIEGANIVTYNTNIANAKKGLYKLEKYAIETGLEVNINTKKKSCFILGGEIAGC